MKTLYIIRGLPGSGKSTLARKLVWDRYREADMFFEKDGLYSFDRIKLTEAHDWCKCEVWGLMTDSDEDVAVSNTFVKRWEFQYYCEMATRRGFKYQIIECQNKLGENIHGVPIDVIERMRLNWER
jgi:predicted kinase